jgi:hypothetical protein
MDDIEGEVTDLLRGDTNGDGILDLGERWLYRLRGTADPAVTDDGQYANVATATGTPVAGGTSVSDEDTSHYFTGSIDLDIEKFTVRIRDNGDETAYQADTPPGPALVENQPVKWRYVVTNDGSVPASNVVITDEATFDDVAVPAPVPVFMSGDDNNDGLLDPGETWIYEAEGTVLVPDEQSPGFCCGQYANVGTVSGEAPDGTVDTDTDPSHYIAAFLEGIKLEKSTNGVDADEPPGPQIDPDKLVRWRYRVSNDGNVALKDVVLIDDIEGEVTNLLRGDDNGNGILDKGEAWVYRLDGVAVAGQYGNVGTITGTPIDVDGTVISDPVSASDPSHYFGFEAVDPVGVIVDIEKFTVRIRGGVETAYQADNAPGPALVENQSVKWRYVVTNRGDEPALNVEVTDEATFDGAAVTPVVPVFMSGDDNGDGLLDPGETWIYEAEGTVLIPLAGQPGQYANVGTVTGEDALGEVSTDTDPSHYVVAFLEGISIEKSTNSVDADEPPGPSIPAGKTVRWRYRLANDGNVALKDVVLFDDQEGDISDFLIRGDDNGNGILDKGEAWIYVVEGTAEPGQYRNEATITGIPIDTDGSVISDPVTDSDLSHYFGGEAPEELDLRIEKFTVRIRGGVETVFPADNPPGPALVENQPVKWRYEVSNRGGAPASNVVVTDEATFEGDPVAAPTPVLVSGDDNNDGLLDPGETWIYEAEGTVLVPDPEAGVAIGQYANVGTVTAEDPNGEVTTVSDPAHYLAAFLEGINIEKSTAGEDADEAPGPSITVDKAVRWRYRVDNDGNVSLKDVTVVDDQEGEVTNLIRGDDNDNGLLDQGEAWVYRLDGIAVEGQYRNVATITGTPIDVDGTELSEPVSDSDVSHYFGVTPQ